LTFDTLADENSQSALNLTSSRVGPQGRGEARPIPSSRTNDSSRHSTEKSSDDGNNSYADIRKKLRDNIGMSYISPTTGKKRAQCNVCLKTFCDRGALKIHFSAVHLREMHACSVEGEFKGTIQGAIWETIWRNLVTILGQFWCNIFEQLPFKNNKICIVSM
jgi:hypothetical protein